jgi:hypothetical protein
MGLTLNDRRTTRDRATGLFLDQMRWLTLPMAILLGLGLGDSIARPKPVKRVGKPRTNASRALNPVRASPPAVTLHGHASSVSPDESP